jgi:hypothetical protein
MSGSSPMWRAPPPPPSMLSTAARSPSAAARMKRWLSPCESGWCGGRAGLLRIPACTVCTRPLPKSTTMLVSKQRKRSSEHKNINRFLMAKSGTIIIYKWVLASLRARLPFSAYYRFAVYINKKIREKLLGCNCKNIQSLPL